MINVVDVGVLISETNKVAYETLEELALERSRLRITARVVELDSIASLAT